MKTETTRIMEDAIYNATVKMGTFGCFEVTLGWCGKERVDYLTYDTKGIWRCYELKASVSDFHSKAFLSFVGHYNYYVMPQFLYDGVALKIPADIGVYVMDAHGYCSCVKRAKKRALQIDEQLLYGCMIRSCARQADKLRKSDNPDYIDTLKREIAGLKRDNQHLRQEVCNANSCIGCVRFAENHRRDAPECKTCVRGNCVEDNYKLRPERM